jgi:septum formation protein
MRIILASKSPRRIALLKELGLTFEVIPSSVDESLVSAASPREIAIEAARLKAEEVAGRLDSGLVIAADTIVCCGGKIYGKPKNKEQARETLQELSGKMHRVITGLALKEAGNSSESRSRLDAEETRVFFKPLDDRMIEDYIATGEPFDKAGGYGIQGKGGGLVERIEGCYFNVVGLPLPRLMQLLSFYIDISGLNLPDIPATYK